VAGLFQQKDETLLNFCTISGIFPAQDISRPRV